MYNSAPLAALVKWRKHSGASNLPPAVTHRRTTQATYEINNSYSISACILPCYIKRQCKIVREHVKIASNTTLKSTVSAHILTANPLPSPLTAPSSHFQSQHTFLFLFSSPGFRPPALLAATDLEVSFSVSAEINVPGKMLITW